MKLFTIILSFYVAALALTPCTDGHDHEHEHTTLTDHDAGEHQHHHDHNSPEDTCTPFCVCACCQSVTVFNLYAFDSEPIPLAWEEGPTEFYRDMISNNHIKPLIQPPIG